MKQAFSEGLRIGARDGALWSTWPELLEYAGLDDMDQLADLIASRLPEGWEVEVWDGDKDIWWDEDLPDIVGFWDFAIGDPDGNQVTATFLPPVSLETLSGFISRVVRAVAAFPIGDADVPLRTDEDIEGAVDLKTLLFRVADGAGATREVRVKSTRLAGRYYTVEADWSRMDASASFSGPTSVQAFTRVMGRLAPLVAGPALGKSWPPWVLGPFPPSATPTDQPRPRSGARPGPLGASATPRDAEFWCAEFMRSLGASAVEVSQATRDGGIDIVAAHYLGEVKHHASPVAPVAVRALFGVATAQQKEPLFFALSGYSAESFRFAVANEIALFGYGFDGDVSAHSPRAEQLLLEGLR
ncbi:hypothetical protein GCM10027053_26230 [Intrasporangium mesophilum]